MSAMTYAFRDSATMLKRNLVRMKRYPSMTLMLVGLPIIFLLMFVYVFGGTMGAGLGGATGSRADYANYLVPGILLISITGSAQGTAISVAMDMAEGIIARFKTMHIYRPSVLSGHVIGSLIQTMFGLAVVVGVAFLVGFRPNATVVEWVAAAGLLALISYAIIWLSVACGLVSKSVETASNMPMPLMLLPFFGSGFVPVESMPAGLSWFAEYQPFTPVMETLRGLLLGTGIGGSGWQALAWCAGITVFSYLWAKRLYNRDPSR